MSDDPATERLTGDGLLACAPALLTHLASLLTAGRALTLDLSRIGAADVSFVQLIVSAARTAERDGRSLTLTGFSPALRVLFEQAGVGVDPAAGSISFN